MEIGVFASASTQVKQIEQRTQVIQLYRAGMTLAQVKNFLDSELKVWNTRGVIIPVTTVRDLIVLNGDEYAVESGFASASAGGTYHIVANIELCDQGGIGKVNGNGDTINVELKNLTDGNITLSAQDPMNMAAVKIRNYFTMNIVSPVVLPENTLCIIPMSGIKTLQKNTDLMSTSEILTHSNRILVEGCLENQHPVIYDAKKSTPELVANAVYTEIANDYAMGYAPVASGKVIIWTGTDKFTLQPEQNGCFVSCCTKAMTELATQVATALAVDGQSNNVDSQEFAAAVAVVGAQAAKQNITTKQTQILANQIVKQLPSVRIANLANVKNFNLASESAALKGTKKLVNC